MGSGAQMLRDAKRIACEAELTHPWSPDFLKLVNASAQAAAKVALTIVPSLLSAQLVP